MSALEVLAFAVATFAVGLWLGERGRRKDAQRREGIIRVDRPKAATVVLPGEPLPHAAEADIGNPPERFLRETMEETGCSRKEAEQEWRALLSQVHTDRQASWEPGL